MKKILSRYIVPYILIMILAVTVLGMAVFYLDGLLVYLTLAGVIAVALGTIPYLIYQDYRTVMKYINNAIEAHKAGSLRENIFETAGVFASDLSGVPSFIIDPVVKKMNEKFPSQKSA